jgi:hypothetical protein
MATRSKKTLDNQRTRPLRDRVYLDAKGRISLGAFVSKGVISFRIERDGNGRIILEPLVEIPARELWLHKNPEVLARIEQGLQESSQGLVASRGDFSSYADDTIE